MYNPQAENKNRKENETMKNILAFLTMYRKKVNELDNLKKEVESMKTKLNEYTKENGTKTEKGFSFVCGQYTVTITECTRTDIDRKTLSAKYPEIAEELKTETTYERTTVK